MISIDIFKLQVEQNTQHVIKPCHCRLNRGRPRSCNYQCTSWVRMQHAEIFYFDHFSIDEWGKLPSF